MADELKRLKNKLGRQEKLEDEVYYLIHRNLSSGFVVVVVFVAVVFFLCFPVCCTTGPELNSRCKRNVTLIFFSVNVFSTEVC